MAYQAIGRTNNDMCQKLKALGILTDPDIFEAFNEVDRGLFAFGAVDDAENRTEAYKDHPFVAPNIHMSAPHMYVSILEALSLHRNGLSFLNIGSGSGYLTCLVSALAGPRSLCHGIDINPAAVQHATKCTGLWQAAQAMRKAKTEPQSNNSLDDERSVTRRLSVDFSAPTPIVSYITGNCFNMRPEQAQLKYDRVYVGAGCPESHWHIFREFLNPGGIMVLPIDDTSELSRVQMNSDRDFVLTALSSVRFSSLVGTIDNLHFPRMVRAGNELTNIDSDDESASESESESESEPESEPETAVALVPKQYEPVALPRCSEWSPFTHMLFPLTFQRALSGIMYSRHNDRRRLPLHVWMFIFTFCPRDWFEPGVDETLLIKRDLREERRARQEAETRLQTTEHLLMSTTRDRNSYRTALREMHYVALEAIGASPPGGAGNIMLAALLRRHVALQLLSPAVAADSITHQEDEDDEDDEDDELEVDEDVFGDEYYDEDDELEDEDVFGDEYYDDDVDMQLNDEDDEAEEGNGDGGGGGGTASTDPVTAAPTAETSSPDPRV